MAQTFTFPGTGARILQRRPTRVSRPTGNKFQEIADRSPKDMIAFDRMADLVLARLNAEDRGKRRR